MKTIEVTPKQLKLYAVVIEDAKLVKKQHSNLFKYGEHEFICDVGAPTVGGVVVFEKDRPLYYTRENFYKKYETLEPTPIYMGNIKLSE